MHLRITFGAKTQKQIKE